MRIEPASGALDARRFEAQLREVQQRPGIPGLILELHPRGSLASSTLTPFTFALPCVAPSCPSVPPQSCLTPGPLFLHTTVLVLLLIMGGFIHSVFYFPIPGAQLGLGQIPSLGFGGPVGGSSLSRTWLAWGSREGAALVGTGLPSQPSVHLVNSGAPEVPMYQPQF